MLGNFEIQRPSLGLNPNKANYSDLSGVTSLLLTVPTFSLTTTEMLTLSNWIGEVADGNIMPIHDIKDSQAESEEAVYLESKQNFRYQARKGKYRFAFSLNVDVDFYISLKKYEGQNLKAYFGDKNGNLIGRVISNVFYPFTLSFISIKKMGFGTFQSSLTVLTVDLSDLTEMDFGYTFKPDFYINQIRIEQASLTDITDIDTTTMQFEVYNSCSEPVLNLVASDFTITDDLLGVLTLNTFTEVGSGVYRYKSDEIQYLGEIKLKTSVYKGLADYLFIAPDFSPADFSADFKIT